MFEEISLLTNSNKNYSVNSCIKNKDGKILFEKEDIKQRWEEYIEELYKDNWEEQPFLSNDHQSQFI